MSTHPITKDTDIPFPCWLFVLGVWRHFECGNIYADALAHIATHYSTNPPDQRPEDVPSDNAGPRPKWCPMCAKWGDHTSGSCPELRVIDAQRIAEACALAIFGPTESGVWLSEQEAATIISRHFEPLARELCEAKKDHLFSQRELPKVIAERDHLRAEVERLTCACEKEFASVEELSARLREAEDQRDALKVESEESGEIISDLRAEVGRLKYFEQASMERIPLPDYSARCAAGEVELHKIRARLAVAEEVAGALQALYEMPAGMPVTDADFAVWEQSRVALAKWKEGNK